MIFDRFRGILPDVTGEGTHFRMPWVQTPHIMDIRTRPRTISSVTGTKGKQQGAAVQSRHFVWECKDSQTNTGTKAKQQGAVCNVELGVELG